MTRPLPCREPWVVVVPRFGYSAYRLPCGGRAAWLAEWRRRIATIERADTSVAARRADLERVLAANRDALRATAELGSIVAVLDATALFVAADCRLAAPPVAAE